MASTDLVQTNGLGLSLASAMKRLMAVWSSTIAATFVRVDELGDQISGNAPDDGKNFPDRPI
jgi:hypothetical protein